MTKITHFITKLSKQVVPTTTENFYFGNSKAAAIRRHNLTLYLTKMLKINPTTLLLGEAPSYKGCSLTGIPFTSERILTETPFYKDQGFKCIDDSKALDSEQSATIVWNELQNYVEKPLNWNIFPFHPHKPGNKKTNRTPNKAELELGANFLNELLAIFTIDKIIALGRKPESQLNHLGYTYAYVRHPAQGGKNEFVAGLKAELKEN
ncbi:uracil-DNA glycosylase [Marixanthomonas spongiae]|uniref:Uracil-DNA glycosylase n=1 Tax=Marixanthomonas spongiae TaxID=2174845 RepID=A0A2U0I2G9_9FLAO|nr:uracil-DNA glycosylase [Marixanthomonas spongiae]PVW15264.1 uracil-DNA glycosylase [Marixanthomonas spongiae]